MARLEANTYPRKNGADFFRRAVVAVAEAGAAMDSSSAANSSARAKRLAGSLARHCAKAASNWRGRSGLSLLGGAGTALRICAQTAGREAHRQEPWPVST